MPMRPPLFRPAGIKPRAARERDRKADHDRTRPNSGARLYGAEWRKASADFKALHPICCTPGCGKPTKMVDHIKPHRGDLVLFWDRSNWQPFCWRCHSRKTAKHDGGFGNRRGG